MHALACLAIALAANAQAKPAAVEKPKTIDIAFFTKRKPDIVVHQRWRTHYVYHVSMPIAKVVGPFKKEVAGTDWKLITDRGDYVFFRQLFPRSPINRTAIMFMPGMLNENFIEIKKRRTTWTTAVITEFPSSAQPLPKKK